MWISLGIAALLLLVAQVVLTAVAHALRPRANIYILIVAMSLATAPLAWVFAADLLGAELTRAGHVYLTLIHLALGGFFFHFMTLPDRSVTLRVLVELLLAPDHALSTTELRRRYSVRTMVDSRLRQLAAGGFLTVPPDGDIVLIGKGLWFGRFVVTGRRLFGIASAN